MEQTQPPLPEYDWRYGRHLHGAHTRCILKEINMLRDRCLMYFVPKVHRKLTETIRVLVVRLTKDPAVINMQRMCAYHMLKSVHHMEKHVKIEVNRVCGAVWRRYALWLAELSGKPVSDYPSKMRAIRSHQADTKQLIQRSMRSAARWITFYLTSMELSVREHCWKARSASDMHARLIEVYVQSRRLGRTLVEVLFTEAAVLKNIVLNSDMP